ncbi:MAG TPA: cytochrome c maturation protein CcmE [Candidatus Thermoplasmatota archaeon]|jgi:cytochrome c-type biogenesis protein CcmE|nr:cytochrome c maturation protein CcmE [Candidatus Thermoplasmatota archaeon]
MRKATRLLLLLAVGLAGAGIAVAGVLPQGFASVSDVASSPERFAGQEVHVKAIVADGSIARGAPARFAITDTLATLPVEYRGTLPELFAGGKTIVVSGVLELRPDGPVLVADTIQGGCASKYEPAPPEGSA